MHASIKKVADALARAGAHGTVRELDESARTAAEAAAALGCPIGAIANSLVFLADGDPVMVLVSGAHRVDTGLLAERLGCVTLRRATPDEVREATGQAIGGVSPVGHPRQLRVVIDRTLRSFPTLWAAAGTPHAVFPTTFDELSRLTSAEEMQVA